MDAFIEDGAGDGGLATVVNNELNVTTESEALKANLRGDAYFVNADGIDPGGAAEDWFYMMNNSNRNCVIYKIHSWGVSTNEEFNVLVGATDAGSGGTAIIPVNQNTAYSNNSEVYVKGHTTNLAVTGGSIVTTIKNHPTTLIDTEFDYPSGIILAPGTRLHMEASGGGIVDMQLYFYLCD